MQSPPPPDGAQPSIPAGTRLYAVGDVHGRMDLLGRLLARMAEDAADAPARRVAVFLGDYVDRGPESRAVVERLMAGPGPELPGFAFVCLKGNHEEAMLRFLEEPSSGPGWLAYGGMETVRAYAGEPPSGSERDLSALQMHLSRALPRAHHRFLSRLPLSHREGDYFFAHAGARAGVALEAQDPLDLMWIRDEFLYEPTGLGAVVVHGHTVSPQPELRPWRIGIDTGAYQSGVLTALVLEGTDRRFLTAEQ